MKLELPESADSGGWTEPNALGGGGERVKVSVNTNSFRQRAFIKNVFGLSEV